MNFKIIAVDFDGTLCENKYPEIGEPNKEMITYLKDRQSNGDKLILWTCRIDEMLDNAVRWCRKLFHSNCTFQFPGILIDASAYDSLPFFF